MLGSGSDGVLDLATPVGMVELDVSDSTLRVIGENPRPPLEGMVTLMVTEDRVAAARVQLAVVPKEH